MEQKRISAECVDCTKSDEAKMNLCPICIAQKIFRGKWKLVIIWHLSEGVMRFSQLHKCIPITQSSLTKQLRELEQDGIILRQVYNIIPPKVEYSLTQVGRSFLGVMEQMNHWGEGYLQTIAKVHENEK